MNYIKFEHVFVQECSGTTQTDNMATICKWLPYCPIIILQEKSSEGALIVQRDNVVEANILSTVKQINIHQSPPEKPSELLRSTLTRCIGQ